MSAGQRQSVCRARLTKALLPIFVIVQFLSPLKEWYMTTTIAEAATPPQSTTSYGLEWPGDGSVRRMLYWHNPFPIYDATYIFKVYPRKKTSGTYKYYTTFFWGNDGTFTWDGGNANTYYGAHPYPVPAPSGPGQWEISVYSNDITTGVEVEWNRWYTQAFRAWRESPSITHHEFYWDWPDTSKVITETINDSSWARTNPPTPAIVMGQAPNLNGESWGGYPGWEEFNGIIRGIQIYSGLLSLSEISSEINSPKSTSKGQSLIWYLNTNPRPSDVTDKKAVGTPHNPSWSGTTALEWTSQGAADTTPPSVSITAPPSGATVSGTSVTVSASASDNVGVAGVQFKLDGANLGNEDTTAPYSISWNTTTVSNGSHSLIAVARDAAGNQTTSAITTVTVNNASSDTTPPTVSMTAPASGSVVSGTINVSASASDNVGVTGVQFKLDGVNLGTEDTSQPYSRTWNTKTVSNGSHSLTAVARDAAGNQTTSAGRTVTVNNNGDTTLPSITNVSASNISNTGATITWTTDEPADSQVEYGTTTSYGTQTTLNTSLTTSHSEGISGLSPNTTYNYRVKSRDAAGNLAVSTNRTFTTTATTELLGYWPFDEGTGLSTVDASGNNNNGTLVRNPVWTPGVIGKALLFNATDNGNDSDDPQVLIGRNFDIPSLPLTITAWINPRSFTDWRVVLSKRDEYSSESMRLDLGLHQGTGQIYLTSSSTFLVFNHAPVVNAWTHIAVVASPSATQLYMNGVLRQTLGAINLGTSATANTVIGGTGEGVGGDNDPFSGTIDEVRVYDRALSASEVNQIFVRR